MVDAYPSAPNPNRRSLAQIDVDAEENERPEEDREQRLADPACASHVVEVVVERGDDDADYEVDESEGPDSHARYTFPPLQPGNRPFRTASESESQEVRAVPRVEGGERVRQTAGRYCVTVAV